ncbi:MAG: hypothetical protein ACFHHU_00575 [Porticoccaceae bacterium]
MIIVAVNGLIFVTMLWVNKLAPDPSVTESAKATGYDLADIGADLMQGLLLMLTISAGLAFAGTIIRLAYLHIWLRLIARRNVVTSETGE